MIPVTYKTKLFKNSNIPISMPLSDSQTDVLNFKSPLTV